MAARSVKTALSEASGAGLIQPATVSEAFRKNFFSKSRKSSVAILFGTVIAFAVAVLIAWLLIAKARVIVFSFKILIVFLFCLIAPIYGVYNIFATAAAIKKSDCEFFYGTYRGEKDDSSVLVVGLEDQTLHFSDTKKGMGNPEAGSRILIARLNDDLSLYHEGAEQ